MIVVIADDFTGAAEIAGLGLRYGLKVVIKLEFTTNIDADLLIIATDSRSMNSGDAYKTMRNLYEKLVGKNYDFVFKKTDSVFRGHILKELKAVIDICIMKKILLVTSNPALGRKIINGKYYIDGKLLNETGFSEDPEFPIETADVLKLLGKNDNFNIKLLTPGDEVSGDGIFLGEAGTLGDLKKLADKVTDEILPVGASGFFAAILEVNGITKKEMGKFELPDGNSKYLIVSGSSYSRIKLSLSGIGNREDTFISFMPVDIFYNKKTSSDSMENWISEIITTYSNFKRVIIEIGQPLLRDKSVSDRLKEQLAFVVERVLSKVKIDEMIIDGGATAYSIVNRLSLSKFKPVFELAPGVIRMKVEDYSGLYLTIKPGSYKWPSVL